MDLPGDHNVTVVDSLATGTQLHTMQDKPGTEQALHTLLEWFSSARSKLRSRCYQHGCELSPKGWGTQSLAFLKVRLHAGLSSSGTLTENPGHFFLLTNLGALMNQVDTDYSLIASYR